MFTYVDPDPATCLHVDAAGAIILQEAGGVLLDPAGGPWGVMSRRVLGCNAHLGPAVAQLLAACKTSPEEPQAPAAPNGVSA